VFGPIEPSWQGVEEDDEEEDEEDEDEDDDEEDDDEDEMQEAQFLDGGAYSQSKESMLRNILQSQPPANKN
jgi:hypothetical protein